jgi:hypothetical protein
MFDLFKSESGGEDLTSPKLEPLRKLASQLPGSPPALQEWLQKFAAAARESGAAVEIGRRTQELLASGQKPRLICFLREREKQAPAGLLTGEPRRNYLLLFTSPPLAHFFVRSKKLPFEILGVTQDDFAPMAEDWRKRKFDGFIPDLSPKAPMFGTFPAKEDLITWEQVLFAWAQRLTIRNWQAQRSLAEFYGAQNKDAASPETLKRQRAALEALRDFGSFDVPFVHWLIALIAGIQKDEAARLESTAVLESFGPDFVGKTERADGEEGSKAWAHSLSIATVGLLAEYGMLKGPDGSPLPSILRIHPANEPPPNKS